MIHSPPFSRYNTVRRETRWLIFLERYRRRNISGRYRPYVTRMRSVDKLPALNLSTSEAEAPFVLPFAGEYLIEAARYVSISENKTLEERRHRAHQPRSLPLFHFITELSGTYCAGRVHTPYLQTLDGPSRLYRSQNLQVYSEYLCE